MTSLGLDETNLNSPKLENFTQGNCNSVIHNGVIQDIRDSQHHVRWKYLPQKIHRDSNTLLQRKNPQVKGKENSSISSGYLYLSNHVIEFLLNYLLDYPLLQYTLVIPNRLKLTSMAGLYEWNRLDANY